MSIGETLTHKIGPLPTYAWVVLGGVAGWWFLRRQGSSAAPAAAAQGTGGTTLVPFDTSGGGSMGGIIGGGGGSSGFPTGGGGNGSGTITGSGGGTTTGGGGTPLPGGGSGSVPSTPVPTTQTCNPSTFPGSVGTLVACSPFQPTNPLTGLMNTPPVGLDSNGGFVDSNGTYYRQGPAGWFVSPEGPALDITKMGSAQQAQYMQHLQNLAAAGTTNENYLLQHNASCLGGFAGAIGAKDPNTGELIFMCPGGSSIAHTGIQVSAIQVGGNVPLAPGASVPAGASNSAGPGAPPGTVGGTGGSGGGYGFSRG